MFRFSTGSQNHKNNLLEKNEKIKTVKYFVGNYTQNIFSVFENLSRTKH